MTKAQGDQETIFRIIDIRDEISQYLNKFEKLTIIPMSPISKKLLKNNVVLEEGIILTEITNILAIYLYQSDQILIFNGINH